MIDWQTLRFEMLWPAWLALAVAGTSLGLWYGRQRNVFPDLALIVATRRVRGLTDRLLPASGFLLVAALIIVLMGPSVVLVERVEQRARDFVILVDTSRSMRHDTQAARGDFALNFRRRVGAFADAVDDPDAMPFVARFELARESLFRFLADRRAGDRAVRHEENGEEKVGAAHGRAPRGSARRPAPERCRRAGR